MEIIQLKYFVTVARLGNVSKAARELYVTQPNLSKSIARLEDELGVPLFEHRKGKIVLNDYGRCFLSSVNLCLEELENGVRSIQRMYESTQNILALGSSIDDLLPDVLRSFAQQHPEIGIRQFDCSVPELYERLSRRTLDLAITARPMAGEGFVFESLGRSEFVILVGKDHPFAGRKTICVKELAGEKLICDRSRMDSGTLSELCRSHGFAPNIVFEVESSNLIYSLLSCNRGIAFMPMVQMRKINNEFPDSGIHMIRIEDPVEPAQLGIVYRRDYDWSQAAVIFAEFLRKWLGQEADDVKAMECITDVI
ncbi:MAG: LysR family transcriptional regulator [Oscillospiraceae bacterium]|nr:LysR family transcriptional regulator [Oscillospiraceae bacterium]